MTVIVNIVKKWIGGSVQFSSPLLYSRILTSFSVSIPLCPLPLVWRQQCHHHLPNHVAFEFFSPYPIALPLILPSLISWKSPSCLKTLPIHRCCLCQVEFSICPSSFTLLKSSTLVTSSSQNASSPHPHYKGFQSSSVCLFSFSFSLRQRPRLCCMLKDLGSATGWNGIGVISVSCRAGSG